MHVKQFLLCSGRSTCLIGKSVGRGGHLVQQLRHDLGHLCLILGSSSSGPSSCWKMHSLRGRGWPQVLGTLHSLGSSRLSLKLLVLALPLVSCCWPLGSEAVDQRKPSFPLFQINKSFQKLTIRTIIESSVILWLWGSPISPQGQRFPHLPVVLTGSSPLWMLPRNHFFPFFLLSTKQFVGIGIFLSPYPLCFPIFPSCDLPPVFSQWHSPLVHLTNLTFWDLHVSWLHKSRQR